ncbi:glycosyltransferase family 39 protein [Patulibacter defluvii]|uniref:glycosyltransferase family 39 protein n=1 Tax=Patulibacter defluvii TaxID=3095358 RepID=UPI002A759A32|nr:glycosyltransferase family 39 protein [Patulibacter sp. DM4]
MSSAPVDGASLEAPRRGHVVKGREAWGLAAVVLLALLLRLPTAGGQSYWLDEAYTVQILSGSLGDAWSTIQRTENTPPLYYLVAWGWTQLTGTGELGVRSLGALAGAAATVPVALLAGRVGGRDWRPLGPPVTVAGLLAALLFAVNPLGQWFAQEARAYSLLLLTAALAWLALAAALAAPTSRRLWWWAGAAVLATWTHYFGGLLLALGSLLLVALMVRPSLAARIGAPAPTAAGEGGPLARIGAARLLPLAAAAVGAATLLPVALAQRSTSMYEAIAGVKSLPERIGELPKQLAIGYDAPAEYVVGIALALVLAGLVLAGAWPRERRPTAATALLGLVALVWALPIAGVALGFDVVLTRNYVVLIPPLAVLAALGALRLGRRGTFAAAVVVVVQLAVIVAVAATPQYRRDDWRGAMRAATAGQPGPQLLLVSRFQPLVSTLYAPGLRTVPPEAPVAVRTVAIVDRPVRSGRQAPPAVPAPPVPAGLRLVRTTRNAQYRVFVWRADRPLTVAPAALIGLLPDGGARTAAVRP